MYYDSYVYYDSYAYYALSRVCIVCILEVVCHTMQRHVTRGGGEGPLEHVHPVGPSYYELLLAISRTTSSMHYILYELVIY